MDLILRGILISNKKIYVQWIFTAYKEKIISWSALCRLEIFQRFKTKAGTSPKTL